MSSERDPHPSREQLAAFDTGRLAPSERAAIARHLADCPVCGRRVDEVTAHQIAARLRPHHWLWLTIAALVAVGAVLILARPRRRRSPPPPPADTIQEPIRTPPVADSPPPDPLVLQASRNNVTACVTLLLQNQPLPAVACSSYFLTAALATPRQLVRLRIERRDQALSWLAKNSRKGFQRALVRDTAVQFATYPGRIEAFQIQLGPQWLDGWPAALLEANLGGFAAYRLTDEQAHTLNIEPRTRLFRCSLNVMDRRRATPRVYLSALRFEDQRVDLRKKIAGSIAYEVRGPAVADVFAVRLMMMLDGGKRRSVQQWFKDQKLEGRGTLRFLTPPLASGDFQPPSPIVVFADLCTRDESSEASRNHLNAYVTLLLQNQPLTAVGCSSYFLAAPSLIVESDAVPALLEALPLAKKPAP